ncbi:phosphoribosyltransferase family protein [Thermincola ferriacetica]|uniref:ComF family protein n=1 Tax=Thermincola ferriacetica TaxID=281456 RepID=UPI00068C5E42
MFPFLLTRKEKKKQRSILLIDDVITTGSTLQEVGKQLKICGADKIFGIALAHTEASFIYG